MAALKVESIDNRSGDRDRPFGFVYFNDGARVGYTPGHRDDNGALRELWAGSGDHPCGYRHLTLARNALVKAGVKFAHPSITKEE